MEIISTYKGPVLPPNQHDETRFIKNGCLPIYPKDLIVQKLNDPASRGIVISLDVEYKIIEAFNNKYLKVKPLKELQKEYDVEDVSGVITSLMRDNFCKEDKAFYLNSSWCAYNFNNSRKWAASDAYILNPYPKDTLLTSTEIRDDYYLKFFLRKKRFFLTGVSFHEVRDEYNGVKRKI